MIATKLIAYSSDTKRQRGELSRQETWSNAPMEFQLQELLTMEFENLLDKYDLWEPDDHLSFSPLLFWAIENNKGPIITSLLKRPPSTIQEHCLSWENDDGLKPLVAAVKQNQKDVVKLMVPYLNDKYSTGQPRPKWSDTDQYDNTIVHLIQDSQMAAIILPHLFKQKEKCWRESLFRTAPCLSLQTQNPPLNSAMHHLIGIYQDNESTLNKLVQQISQDPASLTFYMTRHNTWGLTPYQAREPLWQLSLRVDPNHDLSGLVERFPFFRGLSQDKQKQMVDMYLRHKMPSIEWGDRPIQLDLPIIETTFNVHGLKLPSCYIDPFPLMKKAAYHIRYTGLTGHKQRFTQPPIHPEGMAWLASESCKWSDELDQFMESHFDPAIPKQKRDVAKRAWHKTGLPLLIGTYMRTGLWAESKFGALATCKLQVYYDLDDVFEKLWENGDWAEIEQLQGHLIAFFKAVIQQDAPKKQVLLGALPNLSGITPNLIGRLNMCIKKFETILNDTWEMIQDKYILPDTPLNPMDIFHEYIDSLQVQFQHTRPDLKARFRWLDSGTIPMLTYLRLLAGYARIPVRNDLPAHLQFIQNNAVLIDELDRLGAYLVQWLNDPRSEHKENE
ncbi:MAG: hypothetical protein CL521_01170, partial [Actinobacteria bacterium]|nr:hypothetical protein [Actinomycetota bacterium]